MFLRKLAEEPSPGQRGSGDVAIWGCFSSSYGDDFRSSVVELTPESYQDAEMSS